MSKRRTFIKKSSLALLSGFVGTPIIFAKNLPKGMEPLGYFDDDVFIIPGKDERLTVLNDRPINAETPPHLLDEEVTSSSLHFVRNNGLLPKKSDPKQWTLTIEGESAERSVSYSLSELKNKFDHYTYQLVLECGGNGRSEFNPPAKGNQWTLGAVGCSKWTGVRLKDVLNDVGLKNDAVYIGYYGKDIHLSQNPEKVVISRGIPLKKAMEEETLIAWEMNGEDIPEVNGFPLRLVVGGWPASTSGKWLSRIVVRNKVHDGPKMGGQSYRVPCESVAPNTKVEDEDMCIIESMPVKSLITYPKSGAIIREGKSLELRGHAWAGDLEVSKMEVSIDFGATWNQTVLQKPVNRLAWQHWKVSVQFPQKGYYEVWAKATDLKGAAQPMVVPGWNPRGYLNNACHRIAIKVL